MDLGECFLLNEYCFLELGDLKVAKQFLFKVFELMFDHLKTCNDRNEKVIDFYHPEKLEHRLNLSLSEEYRTLEDLIKDINMTFKYSVKIGHPRFFNQLSQGVDLVSLAAEWVTAAINSNMFTYEVSPVFNLMEECVLRKMRSLVGWQEPGDGIFSPGGTISNLYAMKVAIHSKFEKTKYEGLFGLPKIVVFKSDHSHYSVEQAACTLGIGLNQVKSVPVDHRGKMIPSELEKLILESIERNEVPFMVSITSGTTVLGAFDPIEPIADICQKYKQWLHIDAAWGGGILFSKKHKQLLKGINRADSITWNPHKLMGVHLQASAFLVKHPDLLMDANEMKATYLFQQDKHYDIKYDTGDKTIQCGRHVDVFKVWLMWRAKGDSGFEKRIDKFFDLAYYFKNKLMRRDCFDLVLKDPEFLNICFWYIPKSLRFENKDTESYKTKLNQVAPKIKERMMTDGKMMVSYHPLDDKPNFFRMVISNDKSEKEDMDFVLNEIERIGDD